MRDRFLYGMAAVLVFVGVLQAGAQARTVRAQDGGDTCDLLMQQATAAAGAACADLLPASLCVGAAPVQVVTATGEVVTVASPLPLAGLARITAGGPDPVARQWGIGLLRVPAVDAGEELSAVLFGSATLINDPGPPVAPECQAVSVGTVNVRSEPNTNATILGQLSFNQAVPVVGRLPDSSWWHILWQGEPAWVFAELVPADCDPEAMLVIDPVTGEVSGGLPAPDFQSVRLESDFTGPLCPGAPHGGLLLQSVAGGAGWRVNGMLLRVNGTVLLQAGTNDVLAAQVLEGELAIVAQGVTRQAQAGQLLRAPLRDGQLEGLPGPALDIVLMDVVSAPVSLLPRAVTPPEPAVALPGGPLDDADVACGYLPRQVVVGAEGGRAGVRVAADAGQTIRISAASPAGVVRLAVQQPGSEDEELLAVEEGGGDGSVVADYMANEAGSYRFLAETVAGAEVRFGVTCNLPRSVPPPAAQACDSMLLRWEGIMGNGVRFSAPAGAEVSVLAGHPLPSEGPASTLSVLAATGEALGEAAFMGLSGRQVAGPLDLLVPQAGEYVIQWDGDPFNPVDVEALCVEPGPQSPAEGTPASPATG